LAKGNIAIFTGSNMAGKSTTLKALASTIWLAQCGLPVPADAMTAPIYDAIYTSINLPDSLRDGRSHFMAEVLRIKEVLMQARSGERCLIVLDEMFRGTNAQDAYEASVAVNQFLLEYPNCHFLISTHILEYAKYFEHHPACQFYYMESEIKDDRFICSYRLKEGISESKVGYWIVRKELKLQ
jgi:DNA mismatch repair ATPase MutS